MEILILNGSPKGEESVTLQTALYLSSLHPEHSWRHFNCGQRIKSLERDISPLCSLLEEADMIVWCYPVYTFMAPYQLHRTIELIKASGIDLSGKISTQITTSKHFYDWTAHRFIEENAFDMGLRVVRGLSADMDDLLSEKGREDAELFWKELMFSVRNGSFMAPPPAAPVRERKVFTEALPIGEKSGSRDIVIVTNAAEDDINLLNMIGHFRAVLPHPSRVVNVRRFPFRGGCLGCFSCATDGRCVYTDGFDTFLRDKIQKADAIVYAFTISDHFTHSSFKCYDDRQFCNGHRTVTHGIPTAYLISGDYRYERNLQNIVEGRAEVGGTYLSGVATDEGDTAGDIRRLAASLSFAVENGMRRPQNFLGVGGMKIFRDLIYVMRGLMKADHRYYRENGIYDFPQKEIGTILKMKAVGAMMAFPSVRKRMQGRMGAFIIEPYRKVVRSAAERNK